MNNSIKVEKHFVVSVWIIATGNPKKVLLVHHKKLKKWLQPGGHIETFENPIQAAIREVKEETGLDLSFLEKQVKQIDNIEFFLPKPKYFMEEKIPEYKDQPEHFHLDIMYVVEIPEQKLIQNISELHDIRWFTKEEALKLPIYNSTRIIIQELL